jgi:hypothetical protein
MNKIVKAINSVIDIAKIDVFISDEIPMTAYIVENRPISFSGQNRELFNNYMREIYSYNQEIYETYTEKEFIKIMLNALSSYVFNKQHINRKEVKSILDSFNELPVLNYTVLRDVYGLKLSDPDVHFKLGDYAIYNYAVQRSHLNNKYNFMPQASSFGVPFFLIEWNASARHYEKAVEIADKQFERFELVMRYILGQYNGPISIGILNNYAQRDKKAHVFSNIDHSVFMYSGGSIDYVPIDIDNQYYNSSSFGFDYVWQLASSPLLNEIQKRIILSVEWIGQALADVSLQNAFLKAAIALEILFVLDENAIISPSILNQISESTALTIGKDYDERIGIESEVKKLYGLRSKIVHSGNKNISLYDLNKILSITRKVLIELTTNYEYKSIKEVRELHALFKRMKYS